MATINLDKMPLKELIELEARLKRQIIAAKDKEKSKIKNDILEMAESAGFSVSELFATGRGVAKGSKVAVKYVNTADRTETWTGRGRQPRWLVALLANGASLEDFEV